MLLNIAFACLSLSIYHEARGEPLKGQIAVAQVIMNRAGGDIERVCPVVLAKKQFSWTNTLVVYKRKRPVLMPEGEPKEQQAWQQAVKVAREVLTGRVPDVTKGATHYHATYVAPTWRGHMLRTKAVGKHVFYRNI